MQFNPLLHQVFQYSPLTERPGRLTCHEKRLYRWGWLRGHCSSRCLVPTPCTQAARPGGACSCAHRVPGVRAAQEPRQRAEQGAHPEPQEPASPQRLWWRGLVTRRGHHRRRPVVEVAGLMHACLIASPLGVSIRARCRHIAACTGQHPQPPSFTSHCSPQDHSVRDASVPSPVIWRPGRIGVPPLPPRPAAARSACWPAQPCPETRLVARPPRVVRVPRIAAWHRPGAKNVRSPGRMIWRNTGRSSHSGKQSPVPISGVQSTVGC